MGQELGTSPKVGRMFPVDNLCLPFIAPVSIAVATTVSLILPLHFGILDLVMRLLFKYNNWLLEVC